MKKYPLCSTCVWALPRTPPHWHRVHDNNCETCARRPFGNSRWASMIPVSLQRCHFRCNGSRCSLWRRALEGATAVCIFVAHRGEWTRLLFLLLEIMYVSIIGGWIDIHTCATQCSPLSWQLTAHGVRNCTGYGDMCHSCFAVFNTGSLTSTKYSSNISYLH